LLRETGVIRGTYVEIDPAAVGLPLQALIAVRLGSAARGAMSSFMDRMRTLPQVREVYFLAGADDFLLHVAAADTDMLRRFVVEELSSHAEVALTETNLIFAHARGAALG
jgi:DNA-binding Lrp family transcriptional regulator